MTKMRKQHFKNYIVLVDSYRRSYRCRNTKGRYRVGAKNPKEARKLVQRAIGFGSAIVYYEDENLLAQYKQVFREEYTPGQTKNLGFQLMPVRHANAPIEASRNTAVEREGSHGQNV